MCIKLFTEFYNATFCCFECNFLQQVLTTLVSQSNRDVIVSGFLNWKIFFWDINLLKRRFFPILFSSFSSSSFELFVVSIMHEDVYTLR